MPVKKKFYWELDELCTLWIGYHAHVPLRELAQLLNRSYTSTHKAVRRYNLLNPPQKQKADLLWKELTYTRNSENFLELCEHVFAVEKIVIHEKLKNSPHSKRNSALRKHYERPQIKTENWSHWNDVLRDLERFGMKVEKNTNKKSTEGHEYLINNRPANRSQILLMINRLRAEKNLPPLLIPGITS